MMKITHITTLLLSALITGQTLSAKPEASTVEIVHASDVEWNYLNPKRAELAPMAGTLCGDRKAPNRPASCSSHHRNLPRPHTFTTSPTAAS
jgi:hypothetical protein